jgi:hypothetical protein
MNRYILLSLLLVMFLIVTSCVPARLYDESQQEVNRLKEELADLYEKCDVIGGISSLEDGVYRTECPDKQLYSSITSVQASRSGQSITINFQVLNQGANIPNSSIADGTGNTRRGTNLIYNGNSYTASSVTYAGSAGGYGNLITNVPLKGSVKFTGILPNGSVADYISLELRGICKLEFNNVAFQWSR